MMPSQLAVNEASEAPMLSQSNSGSNYSSTESDATSPHGIQSATSVVVSSFSGVRGLPTQPSLRSSLSAVASSSSHSGQTAVDSGHAILDHDTQSSISSSTCWSTMTDVFAHFLQALRDTPPLRLLWVGVLVVMLMCGSAMQIIFLNFWLRQFPADGAPGNYTTFAVSGFIFSMVFLTACALYVLVKRPNLRFVMKMQGWKLLAFAGLMDTLTSALAVYAASHTSEVLQALFVAMVPVYAALLTKSVLKDPRNYMNPWIVCSFTCIIAGIMIASAYHIGGNSPGEEEAGHGNSTDSPSDQRWWSFLFFISVPFTVLMNVGQTLYMIRYTHDPELLAHVARILVQEDEEATAAATAEYEREERRGGNARSSSDSLRNNSAHHRRTRLYLEDDPLDNMGIHHRRHPQGDDTAVKLVMLAGSTSLQMLMTLMWLPMDALPWYGGSGSVGEAVANFQKGIHSVLYYPHNLTYCCLYSSGFVLVYVAAAYLNQYSVTLCSMVNQMSAPITALVLIIFPSLNLTGSVAPWYMSTIAILLLTAGTFVYVVWDTNTAAAKEEGELQLRLEMMGLQPRAPEFVLVEQEEDGPVAVTAAEERR